MFVILSRNSGMQGMVYRAGFENLLLLKNESHKRQALIKKVTCL